LINLLCRPKLIRLNHWIGIVESVNLASFFMLWVFYFAWCFRLL